MKTLSIGSVTYPRGEGHRKGYVVGRGGRESKYPKISVASFMDDPFLGKNTIAIFDRNLNF